MFLRRPPTFRLLTLLLLHCCLTRASHAQIPVKCLEIESILVDACTAGCPGSQEGQNEMVRFITGPDPLALADLFIDWPNNGFLGLVQNATTASLVAQLNATIASCGHLLEPPGGVIPAGRRVLLITSTDVCVAANSFAALSDTLFVIFQDAGNTAGHFANHNNGGVIAPAPSGPSALRTLIITHTPTSCGDTATYDLPQLVNVYGTYGGNAAENDGATARFAWPGAPVASYVNFGCQAPFDPLEVDIPSIGSVPCGSVIQVSVNITGDYSSIQWSGGTGFFSTPGGLITNYYPDSDFGSVELFCCVLDACLFPVCDSLLIPITGGPTAGITASGPLYLCAGENVTLTGTGGGSYLWSTGATTPWITVATSGTYSVIVTDVCNADTASVVVTVADPIAAAITGDTAFCAGGSTTLTAAPGGATYLWSTGSTAASIVVGSPGAYSVTVDDGCTSGSASIVVTDHSLDVEASASPVFGEAPLPVDFSASSTPPAATWLWDLGDGGTAGASSVAHVYEDPGTYTVIVTATDADGCSDTDTLIVEVLDTIPSQIQMPNVFSPNGDGENDRFAPIAQGLVYLNVDIYDRWGLRIATLGKPGDSWNGRVDGGGEASEGTYYYRLRARGKDGKAYELQGSFTLLR